jgi:hypothetical protein
MTFVYLEKDNACRLGLYIGNKIVEQIITEDEYMKIYAYIKESYSDVIKSSQIGQKTILAREEYFVSIITDVPYSSVIKAPTFTTGDATIHVLIP